MRLMFPGSVAQVWADFPLRNGSPCLGALRKLVGKFTCVVRCLDGTIVGILRHGLLKVVTEQTLFVADAERFIRVGQLSGAPRRFVPHHT